MNAILKTPLMHKKEKKNPPHFVTGVTEMVGGKTATPNYSPIVPVFPGTYGHLITECDNLGRCCPTRLLI